MKENRTFFSPRNALGSVDKALTSSGVCRDPEECDLLVFSVPLRAVGRLGVSEQTVLPYRLYRCPPDCLNTELGEVRSSHLRP